MPAKVFSWLSKVSPSFKFPEIFRSPLGSTVSIGPRVLCLDTPSTTEVSKYPSVPILTSSGVNLTV